MSQPPSDRPVRKVAHDSGDGQTVYHCFSCGSGQVLARSDRTIECEYCHVLFTVQVQPQFPAFPQTINGQPVQMPGMPGQIGGAPVDPSQVGPDGSVPTDPAADPAAEETEPPEDDSNDAPPWAKQSSRQTRQAFLTTAGGMLFEEDYVRHLAIKHANDPQAMAARVREARQ